MNIYGVTKVRYNDNNEKDYIVELKVSRISKTSLGIVVGDLEITYSKQELIDQLKRGKIDELYTLIKQTTVWELGDRIHAVPKDEPLYLRTDGNQIKEDNLGNLPTYD